MKITKEMIIRNILEAIDNFDYYVSKNDEKTLKKIVEANYEELASYSVSEYLELGREIASEGFLYALREVALLSAEVLGLPSTVTINYNELHDLREMPLSIEDWLLDKYDFNVADFEYIDYEETETVVVSDIEWDL